MQEPKRFFITHSFSELDRRFVRKLHNDLRRSGLDGFCDIFSIRPGDDIVGGINRGLEACHVYIPILSFAALNSKWCEAEINAAYYLSMQAERQGRPRIIPVLIEDCLSSPKMPALVRPMLNINFRDRYEQALGELFNHGFGFDVDTADQMVRELSIRFRLEFARAEAEQATNRQPEQSQAPIPLESERQGELPTAQEEVVRVAREKAEKEKLWTKIEPHTLPEAPTEQSVEPRLVTVPHPVGMALARLIEVLALVRTWAESNKRILISVAIVIVLLLGFYAMSNVPRFVRFLSVPTTQVGVPLTQPTVSITETVRITEKNAEDVVLAHTLSPNIGQVLTVAFSPDSATLAAGSIDSNLGLWQVSDGKLIRNFVGNKGGISSAKFSSDGTKLVSGSWDKTVRIWNVLDGTLLQAITMPSDRVYGVAVSPNALVVASGANENAVRLWRTSDRVLIGTLNGHTSVVNSVAFSSNGALVASGSNDHTIRMWRVQDLAALQTLSGHTNNVNSVEFSPDDALLASASSDGTIRLWRVATGELINTLKGHAGPVLEVAFSPDGTILASASFDNTVKLWRVSDGKLLRTLTGHTGFIYSVSFSPDGMLVASGSGDKTILIWGVK